ncbi:MAG: hypothetical protein LBU32_17980 [Clostridiales bacterium]|jgi:hypothetical protein|nr:hypothetical protein [Clostridiales bacterium]
MVLNVIDVFSSGSSTAFIAIINPPTTFPTPQVTAQDTSRVTVMARIARANRMSILKVFVF